MNWLREEGGQCKSGIGADRERGMVPVIKLISPDGKRSVIYHGSDQSEVLSTHMVDYFDRRLQVLSPFRSVER